MLYLNCIVVLFMYDLNKLKEEFIGKTYTYLTITDVLRNDRNEIIFSCICKCGKHHSARKNKILSGNTKSCGCYHSSKEKSDLYKKWCKENPDKVKLKSDKFKQWCKSNSDRLEELGRLHSIWYKNNPDKIVEQSDKYKLWCKENPDKIKEKTIRRLTTLTNNPEIILNIKNKLRDYYTTNYNLVEQLHYDYYTYIENLRKSANYRNLLNYIHDDYKQDLLDGIIKADSIIKTKCPICYNYDFHKFNNIYRINIDNFKNGNAPLCSNCYKKYSTSKYESEIADFISTFYGESPIRNSRNIIFPLELDLYYPNKKIAVEFNGDYFHSDLFKDSKYHYNKFKRCLDNNIILVSIFEYKWKHENDIIKQYLIDLFNGKINSLSFSNNLTLLNNNYPTRNHINNYITYIEDIMYTKNNCKVYTCGYSNFY